MGKTTYTVPDDVVSRVNQLALTLSGANTLSDDKNFASVVSVGQSAPVINRDISPE